MKLTREQRAAFFAGEHPRLTFPGAQPCPVERGYIHSLSQNVWIKITAIKRSKKGDHVLEYLYRDDRPRFPIAGGGRTHDPKENHHWSEDEEHGYTRSRHLALERDVDAVPREYQTTLVVDARKRFAEHQSQERGEEQAKRDFKVFTTTVRQMAVEMARAGVDTAPLLADMQRVVASYRQKLDRAA